MSAPSVIVFDEIDSFAVKRGTYGGSGVEHSLVNQLLTEMDGFRREELVFVIGTTNFAESLDPALLRPGRFEYQLEIPYPDEEARRKILEIHDKTWRLALSPEALDRAVDRTRHGVPGAAPGTHFSGITCKPFVVPLPGIDCAPTGPIRPPPKISRGPFPR